MAIKMVRKPSDTPNINNIDDITGLRYAYGNQNGYVIAKGNEISHSVNGSTFRINSGRLVLQGVEVDIDANGIDLTVDNFATKQFYSVYLTVNLALNSVQIQTTVDTAGFPEIDPGDDLTKNTSGIARLELYRFTTQNGIISNVEKVVKQVEYARNIEVEKAIEAYYLQGFVPTDQGSDIENGTQKKLASAAAIKQYVEEYFMKVTTGTVTAKTSVIGNLAHSYLAKQGNKVSLTLNYDANDYYATNTGVNEIFSVQLSDGFYNPNKQIVCPVNDKSSKAEYAVISTSGLLTVYYKRSNNQTQVNLSGATYYLEYLI